MTAKDFQFVLIAVDSTGNCYQVSVSEEKMQEIVNKSFSKVVISPDPIPTLMVERPEVKQEKVESKRSTRKNRLEHTV